MTAPLLAPSTPTEPTDPKPSCGAMSMEVWCFGAGGMAGSSLDDLVAHLDDETRVSWVDATGCDWSALDALTLRLGLTGAASRPDHRAHHRPRLEAFADHARATIIVPRLGERTLPVQEVIVLITDRFLVFAHDEPLAFRERVEERAAQHPRIVAADSAFLLFILLDEWLHEVEGITEDLDERIEDMEERAIRDTSEAFLDDLVDLKELGFDLSQTVDRHHAVFDAMLNPDFPFVAGEVVENHYRDLSRRFERRVSALKGGRDAINNALSIFSSSTAYRTNRIITLLTVISTVLMPMNVIFAFFGTNFVDLPLFTTPAFVIMWAAVVVVTALIVALLAKRGWLRDGL